MVFHAAALGACLLTPFPRSNTFTCPRVPNIQLQLAPAEELTAEAKEAAALERFSDFLEANGVDVNTVKGGRLPGYGLSLVAGENG